MNEFMILIPEIRDAFKDTDYVDIEDLIDWKSIKGYPLDANSIYEDIKGKTWEDIDYNNAIRNYAGLRYLTPKAFQYYIPGFLIAMIDEGENMENPNYRNYDPIFEILTPTRKYLQSFNYLMSSLNNSQKEVISKLLRLYVHSEEDLKQFRLYWKID